MKEILFEDDVTTLKKYDKKERYIEYFSRIVFEGIFLIILIIFMGHYILLGYFVALLFLIPYPIPIIPDKYKISSEGVIIKNKLFKIKKSYKIEIKKKYVTIHYRYREILRLYSENPKKVFNVLLKINIY